MTRILIVEDEDDLRETLAYNVRKEGYEPWKAATAAQAWDYVERHGAPDCVILDIMLPDRSGIDVCRRLRSDERTSRVPIVMLTARGEEFDKVMGFEAGTDDYVTKPFSVRELLMRVRALLRRAGGGDEERETTVFGRLTIDYPAHRVYVDEEEVLLTPLEFNLLTTLYARKGRVQSRDVLLEDVWGIRADVTTRTVDTHVKRLREKLGPVGRYVETVRGVGYRFAAAPPD